MHEYGFKQYLKAIVRNKTSLYVGRKHFSGKECLIFDTVEMELRSLCNGTCPFCAAAVQYKSRPDRSMAEKTFYKIIDELGELEYGNRICFFINTEPLLDKRLTKFIKYSRGKCSKAKLHVMTNGKLLDNKLGKTLMGNGVDLLEINHYSDDNMLRANIKKIMEEIAPQYPKNVRLNMRKLTIQLSNRGGSNPVGRELREPLKAFCQRPFQKLMISVDGTVGLCENDFYFSHKMGNVNEEGLLDIWNSEKFNKIRQSLLKGDRSISPVCLKCDYSGYKRISNPYERYHGPYYSKNRSLFEHFLEKANQALNKYL